MNNIITRYTSTIGILIMLHGCTSIPTTQQEVDHQLVGTWVGHSNKSCGKLYWEITRTSSGEYIILFYNDPEHAIYDTFERGNWWIKNEQYHAQIPGLMETPDIYHYEVVSDSEIHFTSVALDETVVCKGHYQFIDKLIRKNVKTY